MAPPLKTECKRGHPFTASNTRAKKLSSGYTVRQCKRCRAELDRIRYATDPKRQASVRHSALLAYELAR